MRNSHRQRWCRLRERGIAPDFDSAFVDATLQKYRGQIKSLRRSFESLREALLLLAEALQTLNDRYAIYGFSGNTRLRCELYRIKTFEQAYDAEVRGRIAAIQPQHFTRMGVTIRHLSRLLGRIDARSKLLITLSDGRPYDYDHYEGDYAIEDTRMALYEARHLGIHPFCITIDEQARDYLTHMYCESSYTLINDVNRLPYRISEIYRGLTS